MMTFRAVLRVPRVREAAGSHRELWPECCVVHGGCSGVLMNDTRGLAFRTYLSSPLNAVRPGWLPLLVFVLLIVTWESAPPLSLFVPIILPPPIHLTPPFLSPLSAQPLL